MADENKKGTGAAGSGKSEKKDSKKKDKQVGFRVTQIPQEMYRKSPGIQSMVRLFTEALKKAEQSAGDEGGKNEEKEYILALFSHAIATANYCLQYYDAYLKDRYKGIKPEALYIAAIYFNYYKFTTDRLENKDLTVEEMKTLYEKKQQTNLQIRKNSGQEEAVRYLFVQDEEGQMAHEVIFAANAIDNLMCIKNPDGDPLSLTTVFSILSTSDSFNPEVIKNFEKYFIKQVQLGSEEFRLSFASVEEKTAFKGLDDSIKEALFTVISMVMEKEDEQISVEDLKTYDPKSRHLIVFTSDPEKPQQFFDRRTNTLYTMN